MTYFAIKQTLREQKTKRRTKNENKYRKNRCEIKTTNSQQRNNGLRSMFAQHCAPSVAQHKLKADRRQTLKIL